MLRSDEDAHVSAFDAWMDGGWERRARFAAARPPPVAVEPCYFCAAPIATIDSGCVELFDQETGPPFKAQTHDRFNTYGGREVRGSLAYPGNGQHLVTSGKWSSWRSVAILSHMGCGPDGGYWIPWDRVEEPWEEHLSRKAWWFYGIGDALEIARSVAHSMRRATP